MKKELKIKKDEPIYMWVNRIADYYGVSDELREAMSEISKWSWIKGCNATQDILNYY